MASGIAHDLNQQFGLVSGYGQLAQHALARSGCAQPELEEALRIVTRAAFDGGETVKRLLTFGRGHTEGQPELVQVGTLLEDVAQLTAPRWRDETQAVGRPVRLEVRSSGELWVTGWPHALREALTNLVLNAVDAMPDGGTLELRGDRRGPRCAIEVSDSGVGMSRQVQSRLFEPFFTTKGEKGVGLGLAGVYGIVQRHGGEVEVDSEPGRGSTFRLLLPLAETTRVEAARMHAPAADAAPQRLMVVEDEPALRRMLLHILGSQGHQATGVGSAEEALEALEHGSLPDLLVTDLGLGEGMNGWDLITAVRARWPGLRIVLVTGWGAEIDPAAVAAHGITAVIAKPYRIDDLCRALVAEPPPAQRPQSLPAEESATAGAAGGEVAALAARA
jgi:CheY-like chemotaxis protein